MKEHWFNFPNRKICLDEDEMHMVHQYYIVQSTADYIRENNPDWSEEKVQEVAVEARRQMDKYGFEEETAIEEAVLDLYGDDEEEYCPSSTAGDYSPSNPWDAPGMSIKDFI